MQWKKNPWLGPSSWLGPKKTHKQQKNTTINHKDNCGRSVKIYQHTFPARPRQTFQPCLVFSKLFKFNYGRERRGSQAHGTGNNQRLMQPQGMGCSSSRPLGTALQKPRYTQNIPRYTQNIQTESWGCSAWEGEGCMESSQHLPGPEGANKEAAEGFCIRNSSDRKKGNL